MPGAPVAPGAPGPPTRTDAAGSGARAAGVGSLLVTIPVTLLLGAVLLVLVVRAARRGDYDDWEGPAHRMLFDEDSVPEVEGDAGEEESADAEAPPDPGAGRGADRTM